MPAFDTVTAKALAKVYGPTHALAGVDLTLRAGEVTAIEGPNGSGKSTLASLLALVARPSRGSLHFGKYDALEARRDLTTSIGYVAHRALLYPALTGRENLRFFGKLRGVESIEARIDALLSRFEASTFADRPLSRASRGQLQRLSLSCALLHAPTLLILDEPSTGLDARSTELLAQAIREEQSRGAITVLVTHDAAFAQSVATRRIELERGRIKEARV